MISAHIHRNNKDLICFNLENPNQDIQSSVVKIIINKLI